jgi:hypothetical protein
MSDVVYFNSARGKKTMYGTKLSLNVEKFIEELKANANEAGYCNLVVKDRKAPDKYGNNVYIMLDTWKPDPSKKPLSQQTPQQLQDSIKDDGLPF